MSTRIITGENLNLTEIAYEVYWAFRIVDAAIPLGKVMPERDGLSAGIRREGELTEAQAADRSQLRAIAFKRVLGDLNQFDYEISDTDAQDLLEGGMPAKPGQDGE